MRVTSVDMYAPTLEEVITFGLRDSGERTRYMVRTILGLDAEDIVTKFYGRGLNGNDKFYDFRLKPRDIVLRVVLSPRFNVDESYSDIRDDLYRVISANRTGLVTLHFKSGGTTVASIVGSINKFEAVHFSKLPEVQLTIRCNDPMLKAINPVIFEPGDLAESNPVMIPDSLSTAPHGFCMRLSVTSAIDDFTIQDVETDPEWMFKVIPPGGFLVGDDIYFSSEYDNKYFYIIRSSTTIQQANNIVPTSIWPIIFPGSNSFHFPDIASLDFDDVRYYASYWGV